MKRSERAARIATILDRYHPAVAPFLHHDNPFQLLVAVLLSAQCTDDRVNQVTPELFRRAGDPRTMAALSEAELVTLIRSCGLAPTKARNLIALSRCLLADHHGEVPREVELLEQLPGVGHKTACVVASQAFGSEVFPVDTHIHRLAGRWQLSRARNVDEVERDLRALFPAATWGRLHLQMIEFGRTTCTAKQHVRAHCPICRWAMSKARAIAERRQRLSKPQRPKRRGSSRPVAETAGKPRLRSRTTPQVRAR